MKAALVRTVIVIKFQIVIEQRVKLLPLVRLVQTAPTIRFVKVGIVNLAQMTKFQTVPELPVYLAQVTKSRTMPEVIA